MEKPLYIDQNILQELFDSKKLTETTYNWMNKVKQNFIYELVSNFDYTKRISRAFYKLYEIQREFSLINNKTKKILCLCEAPGGFVEAILNMIKPEHITTQSLENSIMFSNKIPKDIISYGNITNIKIQLDIIKKAKSLNYYDFITADGGIDVSNNYSKQEQLNTKLIAAQIHVIMYSLKKGGSCVIKIYDSFTLPMIQLLWILECNFEKIYFRKLITSRPCNSEKYIICTNYKNNKNTNNTLIHQFNTNEKLNLNIDVPHEYIQKITRQNNNFAKIQIHNLKETSKFKKSIKHKLLQQKCSLKLFNQLKIHNHSNYSKDYTNYNLMK